MASHRHNNDECRAQGESYGKNGREYAGHFSPVTQSISTMDSKIASRRRQSGECRVQGELCGVRGRDHVGHFSPITQSISNMEVRSVHAGVRVTNVALRESRTV